MEAQQFLVCSFGIVLLAVCTGTNDQTADQVFIRSKVNTIHEVQPKTNPVDIREDKIDFVGPRDEAHQNISENTDHAILSGKGVRFNHWVSKYFGEGYNGTYRSTPGQTLPSGFKKKLP